MTFNAKITLKYDSKWTYGGDEFLPEEHCTIQFPADDINTTQIFGVFRKFLLAIGYSDVSISTGALSLAFSEIHTPAEMRKNAEEFDLIMIEDHHKKVIELENEIENLKAKLSRLEQPDAEQYLAEEMDAMSAEAQQENEKELLNKLKNANVVCFDCGSKYGEYHDGLSSVWEGKCNVCGEIKNITESRDFKFLNKGIKDLTK